MTNKLKFSEVNIKDGDLICFAGTSYLSKAIRWYADDLYSHVAIAVNFKDRVFLLEAMDGGIRFFPLDGIIESSEDDDCRTFWHPIIEGSIPRDAFVNTALHSWKGVWQKRYYLIPIVAQWIHLLRRFQKSDPVVQRECYHCAEFVGTALNAVGIPLISSYTGEVIEPIQCLPKDIVNLTCFSSEGIELI